MERCFWGFNRQPGGCDDPPRPLHPTETNYLASPALNPYSERYLSIPLIAARPTVRNSGFTPPRVYLQHVKLRALSKAGCKRTWTCQSQFHRSQILIDRGVAREDARGDVGVFILMEAIS